MKADLSRVTFDRSKHYSSVRMQQGRVQLDADWNEAEDIRLHLERAEAVDLLGACATPIAPDGSATGFELAVEGGHVVIGAGHAYVDGVLVENEAAVRFDQQPDLPGTDLPTAAGTYLFYLEVADQHVSPLDDPDLLEPALGDADTTTRLRTLWQVRATRVGDAAAAISCPSAGLDGADVLQPTDAELAAWAASPDDTETCSVKPGARYNRLENQLYRVEVHEPGPLATATFVWSRDNGSVATRLLAVDGRVLTVQSAGPDRAQGFAAGQFAEVIDHRRELLGQPGTMVEIARVEGDDLVLTASSPAISLGDFDAGVRVRRWDSRYPLGETDFDPADGSLALEDGVRVAITGSRFNTGDHWLIPARTNLGDVIWPKAGPDPVAEPPHGIARHRCRLALLSSDGNGTWALAEDCRALFPPLTALETLAYLAGDGQEATPAPGLNAIPLPVSPTVGVARGSLPVVGARVRFDVTAGGSLLANGAASMEVPTVAGGIAACPWSLDPATPIQALTASLLDASGAVVSLPVTFSARLRTADVVAYDPSACGDLAAAGATTVQAAIDALCARPTGGGGCCVTVGDGGEFATIPEALRVLLERGATDVCLCLMAGRHPYDQDQAVSGFESVDIGGIGPGSVIVPKLPVVFEGVGAITFHDLALDAEGLEFAVRVVQAGALAIRDCDLSLHAAPAGGALLAIEAARTVRIARSALAARTGGDGQQLVGEVPPQLVELAKLAASGVAADQMRSGVAMLIDQPAATKQAFVEGTMKFLEANAAGLEPADVKAYRALVKGVDAGAMLPPPALDRLTIALTHLADLLGMIGQPAGGGGAVAVVIADGSSDAWLDGNTIVGDVALYGGAGRAGIPAELLLRAADMLRQKPGLPAPSGGRLRMAGNTLGRIVLSDVWMEVLDAFAATADSDQLRKAPAPFRDVLLSTNSFAAVGSGLVATNVSAASNVFEQADGLVGVFLADFASTLGNVGQPHAVLVVGAGQAADAANVGINVNH